MYLHPAQLAHQDHKGLQENRTLKKDHQAIREGLYQATIYQVPLEGRVNRALLVVLAQQVLLEEVHRRL